MANNRMYLRCRKCGETLMLAKYYPTTGYTVFNPFYKSSLMDAFFEVHKYCGNSRNNDSFKKFNKDYPLPPLEEIAEENNFDIVYDFKIESDE